MRMKNVVGQIKMISSNLQDQSLDLLNRLSAEWQAERQVEIQAFEAQRHETSLSSRIELGLALKGVVIEDKIQVDDRQCILWFQGKYPNLRLNAGSPVEIIQDQAKQEDAIKIEGYLLKKLDGRTGIMVEEEDTDSLKESWVLEERAQNSTFEKGMMAIELLKQPINLPFASQLLSQTQSLNVSLQLKDLRDEQASQINQLLEHSTSYHRLNFPQQNITQKILQGAQQRHSLRDSEVAIYLIHGPPGTGKSHTLVEIVQNLVKMGLKVLVCAPSNQAVDHLCLALSDLKLSPLRWGHLSRMSEEAEACTLNAMIQKDERAKLAQQWLRKAKELRDRANARRERNRGDFDEMREMYQEAKQLTQEARTQLKLVKNHLLEQSRVICATAVGSADESLKHINFDVVMIDEGAQLMMPLAFTALCQLHLDPKQQQRQNCIKSKVVIFAGDHQQIGPTVLNPNMAQTELLRQSLFEHLMTQQKVCAQMLEIQYRFNQTINDFPSKMHYHGRLTPHESCRQISLEDLGVLPDDRWQGALIFIDCAAKGWLEENDQKSLGNLEMAKITTQEIQRLIQRSVLVKDIIVISPYARQVQNLKQLLAQEVTLGLEIGTVDAFQGREAQVVVVDLVRMNENTEIGFLKEIRRMNVALTRAKRLLMVVGDSATIGKHPYYQAFLERVDQVGGYLSVWAIEG